jgi:hypothetical protein
MNDVKAGFDPRPAARVAGFLYLSFLFLAMLPHLLRASLIIDGDAGRTSANILGNLALFRASILSDLAGQVVFIGIALALYRMFEPIGKQAARFLVAMVLASVPIAMLNVLNELAAILWFSRGEAVQGMFQLELFRQGMLIAELFWGLWLAPFGWLAFRSRYFPRFFGLLLMAGTFGYIFEAVLGLVAPDLKPLAGPAIMVDTVAETAMIVCLLVFGLKRPSATAAERPGMTPARIES